MSEQTKPLVLIILDGWGHSDDPESNAIYAAKTPVWDKLWAGYPHTLISGSGLDVGLPEGQMGNSEVGHMTLGAGRVVYQNFTRITQAIIDGSFYSNAAYCEAIDKAVAVDKAVHLLGLLSPGGVHSHEDHLLAAIDLAKQRGAKQIYVHAFLDGRDTPPKSAEVSLQVVDDKLRGLGVGHVASICGRYYAMDRDQRWDRVQLAFDLLTQGKAEFYADNAIDALQQAYDRQETDEFVKPTVIGSATAINDGDAVLFMNFRADRARQLTRAFVDVEFDGFTRDTNPVLADFVTTTEYAADIQTPCAFPPKSLVNSMGDYLAKCDKTQLRLAETEKYAHVTFFYSGGQEDLFTGEERTLVPSPKVATYDLKPEMSAYEVTDKLVEAIHNQQHDVIICNFANGDMVGHTGIFDAAVQAVETLDTCLGKIKEAVLAVNGECLITADHGNVEKMQDSSTGQPHTAHTCEYVPLVYMGKRSVDFLANGTLADVAPSMLVLLGLEQPAEMTGHSLIKTAL